MAVLLHTPCLGHKIWTPAFGMESNLKRITWSHKSVVDLPGWWIPGINSDQNMACSSIQSVGGWHVLHMNQFKTERLLICASGSPASQGRMEKSDTSTAQSDVLIFHSRSAIFAFKFIYIYTYIITYTRNYYVCSLLWYPYWPLLPRLPNVRTYTSVALGSRPVQHKVLTQRQKNMFRPCLQNIVFKKQTRAKLQPSSTHSKLLTRS